MKTSTKWTSLILASRTITTNSIIPLFGREQIEQIKQKMQTSDVVFYRSDSFPLPEGMTDISFEKVKSHENPRGTDKVSLNFSSDDAGDALYQKAASTLSGRADIELTNRKCYGFMKISMTLDDFRLLSGRQQHTKTFYLD